MGFHGEALLAPRPTPKLEDHALSAVRDCLFNLFAATLHIGGRFSIRKLRTRHAGDRDRLIQESIEKRLNKDNFNRDGGYIVSQAWSPVTSMLLKGKQNQAERVLDSSNEPPSYRHEL